MASSMAGGAIAKSLYEDVIGTLSPIFGSHPGYRPVHAKGVMCEGAFRANADARALTCAPHMQGDEVPVQVRFSNFSGFPVMRDLFLRPLASSGPDAPKPTPLDNFLSVHPADKRFVEAPKPAPRSLATESYFAIDAFRFINREERLRFSRYGILSVAGNRYLDAGEAARRPDNYLFSELSERLAQKPVEFYLMVQVASGDDPIEDPTQPWPEHRQQIEIGTLVLTRSLPDSEAAQRATSFDPARLPDGIEPGDPLIKVRSAIYGIAALRRLSSGA